LRAGSRLPHTGGLPILKLTAELLTLPTFWFTGWVTGELLSTLRTAVFVQAYIVSLAVVFCVFSLYPTVRWIIQLGEEFGGGR
jgi:hypothetical protein